MSEKRYLGDAVYVEYDGYFLRLTTSNGIRTTNEILLERHTFVELIEYVKDKKLKGFEI